MIFYAIRHIKSNELFPEVNTRGGYSHWNPDNPNMPKEIFKGVPRLFDTRRRAKKCIVEWFNCQNGRRHFFTSSFGEQDEDVTYKPDGRTKEDLEVVEITLEVRSL